MRALGGSAATAVPAALLLALTACGATGDRADRDRPPEGPVAGEQVDREEFLADLTAGLEASTTAQTSMTVQGPGFMLRGSGVVDYGTTPANMALTVSMPWSSKLQMDMRLVDDVMYVNLGRQSRGKFVRFDLSDPDSLPPELAALQDQTDPLGAAYAEFEAALTSVSFESSREIAGDRLSQYRLVLDADKLDSLQGIPADELPDEVEYHLWFDDRFRAREMTMSLDLGDPVDVQVRMFAWGEPVTIEAPPARQVVDPAHDPV